MVRQIRSGTNLGFQEMQIKFYRSKMHKILIRPHSHGLIIGTSLMFCRLGLTPAAWLRPALMPTNLLTKVSCSLDGPGRRTKPILRRTKSPTKTKWNQWSKEFHLGRQSCCDSETKLRDGGHAAPVIHSNVSYILGSDFRARIINKFVFAKIIPATFQ